MPDFPKPTTKIINPFAVPLNELVATYQGAIDLLKKELKSEIEAHKKVEKADPNFGDDIYLVRFVAAYYKKGFDKVRKYLRQTMEWRAKNADTLVRYRSDPNATPPHDAVFRQYMLSSLHYRNAEGHFVCVMRNGLGNADNILEKNKVEDLKAYMVHLNEPIFQKIDECSRNDNKLYCYISILDFKHGNMSTMGSSKYRDACTESTKETETFYPLLAGLSVIFNMPTLIRTIMKMALFMMPASMQEKMLICSADDDADRLAFAKEHLKIEPKDMPTFLGGSCNCQSGCCLGIPNAHDKILTPEEMSNAKQPTWEQYMVRMFEKA